MTSFDIERRKILKAGGAGVLAGLAGCTGILADGTGVPGKSPDVEEEQEGESNVPPEVDDALSSNNANLYEGDLADHTGEDEVVIEVGAGDGLAFDDPAVRVDPGTTILWEWTGEGGNHNVVHDAEQKVFNSGDPVGEAGFEYESTFEDEGNYVYFCGPHSGLGMWGAIVVGGGGGGDAVAQYLNDNNANLYEGEVADHTGESEVTVAVGAGDGFAFDEPAIRINPETAVVWEWTGEGGGHNVKGEENDLIDSGDLISDAGHTYEVTFEETGEYLYFCDPHKPTGMVGAVIVEE